MKHEARQQILSRIFRIQSTEEFEKLAWDVFRYQSQRNTFYRDYLDHLKFKSSGIDRLQDIPFLPIEFFKSNKIVSTTDEALLVFKSSGTTGSATSLHYVPDPSVYERSFRHAFNHFYGNAESYCILAILPGYLEREGSSLIFMLRDLIGATNDPRSGFYLNNTKQLSENLNLMRQEGKKTILFGVTFALVDFAESYPIQFPGLIVMETGGMKGKRREMVREEVHQRLCQAFGVEHIHSEYGMTELLSQAYSQGNGIFRTPPWMKIYARDTEDPFSVLDFGRTGGLNVIDLANIDSCSFIATEDLGKLKADGSFEVLGRFDSSDVRGCNLLIP